MKKATERVTMSKNNIVEMLMAALIWLGHTKIDDPRGYAAQLIGKSRRTIDAYIAPFEDRTITPEDLQTLCFEAVRRFMTAHKAPTMEFEVCNTSNQPLARTRTLVGAIFLADIEDGRFEATPGVWRGPFNDFAHPDVMLRSQLRRIMRSGKVTIEQACSVLGCCEYTLVAYQVEFPCRPRTPPEFGVRYLQALVAEQIGEVA